MCTPDPLAIPLPVPFRPAATDERRDVATAAVEEGDGDPPTVTDEIGDATAAVATIGLSGDSEDDGRADDVMSSDDDVEKDVA